MPLVVYTPSNASQVIGVHPNSIREWCRNYAEHLSAGANPRAGQPRQLSPTDVARMQMIKQWRAEGYSTDVIGERLATLAAGEPVQPYIEGADLQETPQAVTTSSTATTTPSSPLAPAGASTETITALTELTDAVKTINSDVAQRVEKVEQRMSQLILLVAVGAVIAFAAGGLFVLLILRLGQ